LQVIKVKGKTPADRSQLSSFKKEGKLRSRAKHPPPAGGTLFKKEGKLRSKDIGASALALNFPYYNFMRQRNRCRKSLKTKLKSFGRKWENLK
jgi:hypothetical protein